MITSSGMFETGKNRPNWNKKREGAAGSSTIRHCPNPQCGKPIDIHYVTCSYCGTELGAYDDLILMESLSITAALLVEKNLFSRALASGGNTPNQNFALYLRCLMQELESADLPRSGSPSYIAGILVARASSHLLQSVRYLEPGDKGPESGMVR